MSSNSDNPSPMTRPPLTCAEFEASFDQYVDDLLDIAMTEACSCHLAKCPPCDREVTRWQQTRILLSTAVTDFATAVDVSSVRDDVFAALGLDDNAASERRRSAMREAAVSRGRDASVGRGRDASTGRSRDAGRSAGRQAADSPRRSGVAGALRFASAATVSALTAAAAVLLLTPTPQSTSPQVASVSPPPVSRPSAKSAPIKLASYSPWSNKVFEEVAPATNTPPPFARPQASHVDGLEAAPGKAVSTWVQPRTNARVIWVEDVGVGAPVRMAGLGK